MASFWICLLLFLPLFLLWLKITESQKNHPPGPTGLPFIGNLHQLGFLPHRCFQNLTEKYGPIIRLKLGKVSLVVLSDPETAREILKNHDIDCCSRPRAMNIGKISYNYLDVSFAPFNDYWREMRKLMVLELLSSKRVQSFRFIRAEEVEKLVKSIARSAVTRSPVNLSEKIMSVVGNVIGRVAFGGNLTDEESEHADFHQIVHDGIAILGRFCASDYFPYYGWIIDRFTGLHDKLEKTFVDMDKFLQKLVDQHLDKNMNIGNGSDSPEDLIDLLLKIEKEQFQLNSVRLTKDHIKSMIMEVFLAGIETSTLTTTWAMTELIRNPTVLKKVTTEIRECIGKKGKVDETDLDQLSYLKLVVKETLRLHAPSPLLLPREVMNPFKVKGYTLYPGTRVQVNVWAIGRDPKVWKDPLEFIPERFADNSIDYKGNDFELLPFGGGRRGCPAIYLGTVIVELALANLLYRFDWELLEGMGIEDVSTKEEPGLTIRKKIPLELIPIDTQL